MHLRILTATMAAGLALGVSACGSDDDDTTSTAAPAAAAKPIVEVAALKGQSTAISLTPSFAEALGKLKAQGAALGSAKISATGRSTYPITGGSLKYFKPGTATPALQGRVEHDGSGLRLSNGRRNVDLRDFVVDLEKSVLSGDIAVDGKPTAQDTPLFALDAATLKPKLDDATGIAVLKGFTVKLEKGTADLLNTTFGTQGVGSDELVGTATVTVETK